MARQRYCRRLTRYRNTLRVSADPVAKPAAQTRAESRVLDLRKLLRERDRLSAGGRWIRTFGSQFGNDDFRFRKGETAMENTRGVSSRRPQRIPHFGYLGRPSR